MIIDNFFETKFKSLKDSKNKSQNNVKFIHASDIHLGTAQYRNEYRSDDFIRAFQQILELAINFHVDFILLGGDIFTSLEMLPGKLTKIINILMDFKEFTNDSVLIIAIEGNHDIRKFSRGFKLERRGQSWLKLLNSLGLIILLDIDLEDPPEEMFKHYNFETRKGGKIQVKNVIIYGTHYLGEKPISLLLKIRKAIIKNNNFFNILLQHFGIEGQMENVPGVKLEYIQSLRHRVDYVALGHFHKQFILEDWIYNPGSSEAVCSTDNSFKRGIFLVEISKNFEKFVKHVKFIRLINRKYLWYTIHFDFEIHSKQEFESFVIDKLKSSLTNLNYDVLPSNPKMPILLLILKGKKPSELCKVKEKDLRSKICETFPIIDVRIYQKYMKSTKTLDSYILV